VLKRPPLVYVNGSVSLLGLVTLDRYPSLLTTRLVFSPKGDVMVVGVPVSL